MAPGCGAFSHEFLAALGELMDDEDVNLLEALGLTLLETSRAVYTLSGIHYRQSPHTKHQIDTRASNLG